MDTSMSITWTSDVQLKFGPRKIAVSTRLTAISHFSSSGEGALQFRGDCYELRPERLLGLFLLATRLRHALHFGVGSASLLDFGRRLGHRGVDGDPCAFVGTRDVGGGRARIAEQLLRPVEHGRERPAELGV